MDIWPRRTRGILTLAVLLLALACADTVTAPQDEQDQESTPTATPQNPLDGFVTVSPGVRLHYLDFGGSGEPVFLLAGLGNTANVYRDFAPLLTDRYRVRALTRRGYGGSSQPSSGYDRPTLAQDIRAVLDSLDITTVHLVGHSIAGDAMTRFAIDYPNRLGKIVYLDAAYDRTDVSEAPVPEWQNPPLATAADLASRTGFRAYAATILGVTFPTEEIVATTRVGAGGEVTGLVTPPSVQAAMTAGAESPDYPSITAPAMGLYAVASSASDVFPWLSAGSTAWSDAEAWLDTVGAPTKLAQRGRFKAETPNGSVVEIDGANHYLFLSDAARVAAEVVAFLSGS